MSFDINILKTGSDGNCIVIDDRIMIDCGLGYRTINKYLDLNKLDAILITHKHQDHFNRAALTRIFKERPEFAKRHVYLNQDTKEAFYRHLKDTSIIDMVYKAPTLDSDWSTILSSRNGHHYHIQTYKLPHGDAENQGFIITNDKHNTLIHATDTETMKYAPDRKYDYLLIEGNWDYDKYVDMLRSKDPQLIMRALFNTRHLSVQDFEKFVKTHSHEGSVIIQLHESSLLGTTSVMNRHFTRDEALNNLTDTKK